MWTYPHGDIVGEFIDGKAIKYDDDDSFEKASEDLQGFAFACYEYAF